MRTGVRAGVVLVLLGLTLIGVYLTFAPPGTVPGPDRIATWIEGLGGWAPAAVILLMIGHSFVPFPAEIVALCAGAVFGTLEGVLLVWSGAMAGAVLSFWLARTFGREFAEARLSEDRRARLEAYLRDHGSFTLLVARFIPVIAFNLVNYAAGLTRVGSWTFLWTTAVGILPATLLTTWLGGQMRGMSWPMLVVVSVAAVGLAWAGHWLVRRRGWF